MGVRRKLSDEARMLIREYGLRVARKKYPNAIIDVQVGNVVDENGQVERTITVIEKKADR